MTRVIACRKAESRSKKNGASFYGAIKSENELYFQIASLFREATKGSRHLSEQMVEQMIKAKSVDCAMKEPVYNPY